MRRRVRIGLIGAGVAVGLVLLLVAAVFIIANTDPGRRLIERVVAAVSNGHVLIRGLAGRFPDHLRAAELELRDANGTWASAQDITVEWSPSLLITERAEIDQLHIGHAQVARLPLPTSPNKSSATGWQLELRSFDVPVFDLGAALAGAPASMTVHGNVRLRGLKNIALALTVKRLDGPGDYELSAEFDPAGIRSRLSLSEPAEGPLAHLVGLPDLGALTVQGSIDGERAAEHLLLTVAAGPLRANADGTVDLLHSVADLEVAADAPAMSPRPDLAWNSVSVRGRLRGPWTAPEVTAHAQIAQLRAGDAGVRSFDADIQGSRGSAALTARLESLRIPGPKPDLLAEAPLEVRVQVRLDDKTRPVTFSLAHPLLQIQGRATSAGDESAVLSVVLPSLAPLGSFAGIDVRGHSSFEAHIARHAERTQLDLNGRVAVDSGQAPLPGLLGNAKIAAGIVLEGKDLTVEHLQVDGSNVQLSASGSVRGGILGASAQLTVARLAVLTPTLTGNLNARIRIRGRFDDLALDVDGHGQMATQGLPLGGIDFSLAASGLPGKTAGSVRLHGLFDGSPVELAAAVIRDRDGTLHADIRQASWKSARAEGSVTVPTGKRTPQGHISAQMTQLEDLRPLLGLPLEGNLSGRISFLPGRGSGTAELHFEAHELALADRKARQVLLSGRVDDPLQHPSVALELTADDVVAQGITGSARLEAHGPTKALQLELSAKLAAGHDAQISGAATLDLPAQHVLVSTLAVQYQDESARLLGPAQIAYGSGLAVEQLRIGVKDSVLELSGRVSPELDLKGSLRNMTPEVLRLFAPDLQADGVIAADVRLRGTTAAPQGTIHMTATGLRMRSGPARAIPAANIVASAQLDGTSATLSVKVGAGNGIQLAVTGKAPLSKTAPMDLHAVGDIGLEVANPILEASGRQVRGRLKLDTGVTGTLAAPRLTGTLQLSDADVQDYALGVHLTAIAASMQMSEETLRVAQFTARAGHGTISATGTLEVLKPGIPVDLHLIAHDAEPFASDLLAAAVDADITARGQALARLDLAGTINVKRATITIPNALPPSVAVLDVRRPGKAPVPPDVSKSVLGFELQVDAPRAIFVRGRGLDAEMGGDLTVRGTSATPSVSGGFDMRNGSFDLAGTTLQFATGRVSFNGTGVHRKIDPTLDFTANSTAAGVTATLKITGYADAPVIDLSSVPELPQDEVLARLLFGTSITQLSALQVAQIAAALASMSGVGGGYGGPLATLQKKLGLDRLSVGGAGGTDQTGASLVAGRYVSSRVYVGAKQTTTGTTQAQVQFDLTKHLKLQTTVGTGGTIQGTPTPENDPGNQIGLTYQFEY